MGCTAKTVGANAERSRSHNRQMVLDRVRQGGQMARAEIARATGLSTHIVHILLLCSFLRDRRLRKTSAIDRFFIM